MSAPAGGSAPPRDIHDIVGVGLGPFNLALAALADGVPGVDAVFVEEQPSFRWHPGLLLEDARLQVPFLADLVTLVDPTSPWSFLAFLRAHDRLFPFYFAERFHVPRREYDEYCRWVATSLPGCRFGARALAVRPDPAAACFAVDVASGGGVRSLRARNVVLGIGTEPAVPACFAEAAATPGAPAACIHAADYLAHRDDLRAAEDVTVIGSGQSGAEVVLDLLRGPAAATQRLAWLTRSAAFAPMEYSKLGLEHFTPDYTRYFHGLDTATRDRLVPAQWQLYKAASAETLAEIHAALYDRLIDASPGRAGLPLLVPGVEVVAARQAAGPPGGVVLTCRQSEQGTQFTHTTGRVVLATGYRPRATTVLDGVAPLLATDEQGRYVAGPDYRLAAAEGAPARGGGVYVQNGALHTHGVGTPDLGLGAYRAAVILEAVTGRSLYRLPDRAAFTTFGVPGGARDGAAEPAHSRTVGAPRGAAEPAAGRRDDPPPTAPRPQGAPHA